MFNFTAKRAGVVKGTMRNAELRAVQTVRGLPTAVSIKVDICNGQYQAEAGKEAWEFCILPFTLSAINMSAKQMKLGSVKTCTSW